MKTHLPKGLRAALMAALASVSLTAAYAAAATPIPEGTDWTTWTTSELDKKVELNGTSGSNYYVNNPGKYTQVYALGAETPWGDTLFATTQNFTSATPTYVEAVNNLFKGVRLISSNHTVTGDIYFRSRGGTSHTLGAVFSTEQGDTVKGNLYMELNQTAFTYAGMTRSDLGVTKEHSVFGVLGSNVDGSNTVVIKSGTFNKLVTAGLSYGGGSGKTCTINGGTFLQISGGTFAEHVVAGNTAAEGNGTTNIKGGTHLLINGGATFNNEVVGGSVNEGTGTINGGVSMRIEDGTFKSRIYGGSISGSSTINDGINLTIAGGDFKNIDKKGKIYTLGYSGTVKGNVDLTITGDSVQFADNYEISAGTNGTVTLRDGTSTVTLQNISSTTHNSLATNSSIKVMGGNQTSTLVMDNVDTTIQAQLSQFSTMSVTNGSDLTLTRNTNANLGGVSKVVIDGNSTLNLDSGAGLAWTGYTGSIEVKSGSKLHLSGATNATLNLASGSTLAVKEGDLFAANPASGYTLSGVTLEANEGNWTINKAATVNGATITGSHAVAFGSEVDPNAKVTMSGAIGATEGNLLLKNTTVAANTTATLSGNITFEGVVDNKGTLEIANGSTINIDEQSLIRNGRFIDGPDTKQSDKNGFFADTEVCLSTGGSYSYTANQLTLTLDGKEAGLVLTKDAEKNQLLIGNLSLANTYFVREGNVTYSHIADVADTLKREVKEIAVGTNGEGDTHQLTLDKTLAGGVTVVSASDHAKVLLSDGVVLNASQTAIKGEANELHVTGAGTVLLDNAAKLSQLAGDATMKVTGTTTISGESKMTGKLNVESGDLTVTDEGTIASFKTVNLCEPATLTNKVAAGHEDTIQSLSGSGTLSKTGEGTLAISGDSSEFAGSVNIGSGTLEVQNDMNTKKLSGSGKLVKTGEETTLTVQDASGFTGDISVSDKALVNLLGVGEGVNVSLHELVIDNGTLGVYVGNTSGAGENEANVGALTLTSGSRIVVGGDGGTLEANLTTECDSILDFTSGGVLTMGCDLTVGEGTIVLLNESDYATLAEGGSVTLFSGVDNDAMKASNVSIYLNTVGSADKMLAQVSFSSENGTVSVSVPEPATATLSLLALAGLAARRRRSKAVAA